LLGSFSTFHFMEQGGSASTSRRTCWAQLWLHSFQPVSVYGTVNRTGESSKWITIGVPMWDRVLSMLISNGTLRLFEQFLFLPPLKKPLPHILNPAPVLICSSAERAGSWSLPLSRPHEETYSVCILQPQVQSNF
jgi:hypothetical protein